MELWRLVLEDIDPLLATARKGGIIYANVNKQSTLSNITLQAAALCNIAIELDTDSSQQGIEEQPRRQ